VVSTPEQNHGLPRRLNLPWRQLAEDRAMLLNLDSGDYYELGGSAPYIWRCLDGTRQSGEIARLLMDVYQIDSSRAESDLNAFICELEKTGLLSDSAQAAGQDDLTIDESSAKLPYQAPTIGSKGNLKYLGQLD